MRVASWVPQDIRTMIESIDPAADIGSPLIPPAARIVAAASELPDVDTPQPSRHRMLATLATVLVVLIAAAGVLIIRGGSHATRRPASRPPTSTVTTPPSTAADPLPVAAPPPTFPVSQKPRPIVLLGEAEIVSGFPDTDSKVAFMDGDVDLATTVPTTPASRNGYPVMPAADAVRRIINAHSCCVTTSTRLRITSIRLIDHLYLTDRGNRLLPAWRIRFAGLSTTVTVLAVTRSARYPIKSGGGTLTVSDNGRTITIYFIAHHTASGPCDQEYRSFLALSETSTAVRISVRTRTEPPRPAPSGVICDLPLTRSSGSRQPVPGSPDTKTFRLQSPLGNRLVVDADNRAYLVTNLK